MKRFVNGTGVELEATNAEVVRLSDRLVVKSKRGANTALAVRKGDSVHISYLGQQYVVEKATRLGKHASNVHSGELRAPMPGLIVDVFVTEGEAVIKGQKLVVLEAMKTQQPFAAPFDGVVQSLKAKKGDQVSDGELLAIVQQGEE